MTISALPFSVLFEDELILAVNKPAGMPSHSIDVTNQNSVELILAKARAPQKIFLLHRLDTGTSGILLFAKDAETYTQMREQFQQKKIKKIYHAWSNATPASLAQANKLLFPLNVTLPLAHHSKSKKRMIALPADPALAKKISYRGKPFPTHTRIFSVTPTQWFEKGALHFELEITTGVTHQIRVHLQQLGFPLFGDAIYGGEPSPRLGLHAEKIEFELQNFRYSISAPLEHNEIC